MFGLPRLTHLKPREPMRFKDTRRMDNLALLISMEQRPRQNKEDDNDDLRWGSKNTYPIPLVRLARVHS